MDYKKDYAKFLINLDLNLSAKIRSAFFCIYKRYTTQFGKMKINSRKLGTREWY